MPNQSPPPLTYQNYHDHLPPQPNSRKSVWIWIVLIVIVAAAAVSAYYLFFTDKQPATVPTVQEDLPGTKAGNSP